MNPEIERLQTIVDRLLANNERPRVLEAGCGSLSALSFGARARLIGIDISKKQLERNTAVHQRILGDIQRFHFKPCSFDAIVCWDTLEHLPEPEKALENFAFAVTNDGVIILAFPYVRSLKALLTKFTPHWLHVWVYRSILGDREAGKQDRAPFKTYLRFAFSPANLRKFAASRYLTIEYFSVYQSEFVGWVTKKNIALKAAWKLLQIFARLLSFGTIDIVNTDIIVVLRKRK